MLRNLVFITVLIFLGFVSVSKSQVPVGFEMPKIIEPKFKQKTFDIRNFGAKADGLTINTKPIAEAIEAARKAGRSEEHTSELQSL